ncbi:MAG TPA: 4Fe-4S ferredoxin [candidate division Zixibacteria bacterium]|nr:4Fe-4S ferredoxin [candidate division Zixibacteria bacterium]
MTDKNPKPEDKKEESKVSGKTEPRAATVAKPAKKKYKYDGKTPPLNIFLHWCKACNLCIAFCPTKVLEPDRDGKPVLAHPELCTQCEICWLHCPDFAITSTFK